MEKIEKLKEFLAGVEADLEKFEKGNNAAGKRVRKAMQQIKTLAQGVRQDSASKLYNQL